MTFVGLEKKKDYKKGLWKIRRKSLQKRKRKKREYDHD